MIYCSPEKETGTLLFSRIMKLVHNCFQDKGSGALLFSGERNRCSTVFRRSEQVHYCSQKKETGALLFSEEGIW